MKPKRIILVRHGESEGNADRRMYTVKPDYALDLSKKGIRQAQKAGRDIMKLVGDKPCMFYVSPFFRTRRTYQYIRQSVNQWRYYEEPRIREQEWTSRIMATDKALEDEREKYSYFWWRFELGESNADVYDRVSGFLNTMYRDFEKEDFPENVIIVTHGMLMRVFLMRFLHWTVEEFELLRNPKNCGQWVLELDEKTGKYNLATEIHRHPSLAHGNIYDWDKLEPLPADIDEEIDQIVEKPKLSAMELLLNAALKTAEQKTLDKYE